MTLETTSPTYAQLEFVPRARRTLEVGTASPEPQVATASAGKEARVAAVEDEVVEDDEDPGVEASGEPPEAGVSGDEVFDGVVAADG